MLRTAEDGINDHLTSPTSKCTLLMYFLKLTDLFFQTLKEGDEHARHQLSSPIPLHTPATLCWEALGLRHLNSSGYTILLEQVWGIEKDSSLGLTEK